MPLYDFEKNICFVYLMLHDWIRYKMLTDLKVSKLYFSLSISSNYQKSSKNMKVSKKSCQLKPKLSKLFSSMQPLFFHENFGSFMILWFYVSNYHS